MERHLERKGELRRREWQHQSIIYFLVRPWTIIDAFISETETLRMGLKNVWTAIIIIVC